MISSLEIAYAGMKASLDQLQCIGEQMAQVMPESNLAEDVVELIAGQRTFEANATMVQTADQVVGSVIDLIV